MKFYFEIKRTVQAHNTVFQKKKYRIHENHIVANRKKGNTNIAGIIVKI